ncbi:hypothetical protein NQD34_018319 [Periophthalmus magnuspinnatus]|nr:hypothetical protein NQD34_018319 [Periophthalmus magnuspinnatus]
MTKMILWPRPKMYRKSKPGNDKSAHPHIQDIFSHSFQHKHFKLGQIPLNQWFLTLLEVLNPTCFICIFTEPFFIENMKNMIFFKFKTYVYFTGAQNEPYINITVFNE